MGKILIIAGLVGLVIAMGALCVSVLLPVVNAPRTSWEEAMWGIIPGALCSFLFFVLTVVGVILLLTQKDKTADRPRSRRASHEF